MNFETKLYISHQILLEVANFVMSEVRIIQCSWFDNITTNEFKQSEKNGSTKLGLFYDVTSEA